MRITASHIVEWVNTDAKVAQTHMPLWIRRLCFDPGATLQLSFPAGDSTYIPSWDGVLFNEKRNAWVPAGASCWEIGCDKDTRRKANDEYRKRTKQTREIERFACTFVFVTPRRWLKKSDWVTAQRGKDEWADVRAYDADDLEQWLEQTPAVALQFAEKLGLGGWGVMSLSQYWDLWSRQCSPTISFDALFMDRSSVHNVLAERIQQTDASHLLAIRADSVEEAAAFAVAVVISSGSLQDQALVVTETAGWRYVESNQQLKIAIAARTEIAANPLLRDGLLVIVPHATGDLISKQREEELILERPNIYEFEKALIAIGLEESEAKRYALSTGRSWTVFRRQKATNPAIQRPAWLDSPQSTSLSLLCLLGAWHADKIADRQVVERLAARSYEEIERDLRQLVRLDDSPILSIGMVWKAKSPLELLNQLGDHITSDQLDRFFAIAREMLSSPDPQLGLPDEERWMAQVRGKIHPYSGLLFESVCDSLVKLAVRGPEQGGLQTLNIEERVAWLIRELLDGADGQRWLSLSSYLPTLAEAAPDAFLQAVEKSLRLPDTPVTRLITETGNSGFGGCCWHSGLLWALETLAWAPKWLARVALILAHLSHLQIKGNWGNTPIESLLGLFRSWLPQTAASLTERIQVIGLLMRKDEQAAFGLLERLAGNGSQMATPASRPKWREDDTGAGHSATYKEIHEMLAVAKEKLFQISKGNAARIASLLDNTILRRQDELPKVLVMINPFTEATANDEDRDILRTALRKIIHWHRNYDESSTSELEEWLGPVELCYERLAPKDLVTRHRWLFDSHWLELPSREREEDFNGRGDAITQLRASAITEIYQATGIAGIESLILVCAESGIVGMTLARVVLNDISLSEWVATKGEDFILGTHITWCIAGILHALSLPISGEFLQNVIAIGKQKGWDANKFARFLVLAKPEQVTWHLAETCGPEVYKAYWENVRPNHCHNADDPVFVFERLLEVKRPRTALQYSQGRLNQIPPVLLFTALQKFLQGEEIDGPRIEPWHLAKMLERLEDSREIEKMDLVQLEFSLFPALGHGQEASAATLFAEIMSDPTLFTQLICILYKPEHGERREPTETSKVAAEHAWQILHDCKRLPGTQSDGTIDENVFLQFIDATRESCRHADRSTMGDRTLGQIIAHSPADEDGTWPFSPTRELLDRPELEEMRRGFSIGTMNKRGVTSRSPWDGGSQERDLADYYRSQAERIQYSHPYVAALLEDIAKNYEQHGKREDEDANLNKESF